MGPRGQYKSCPHCASSEGVRRRGIWKWTGRRFCGTSTMLEKYQVRRQAFHCRLCGRHWCSKRFAVKPKPYSVTCWRCNAPGRNVGPGNHGRGRKGHCDQCARYFVQGGSRHLRKHIDTLRHRVESVPISLRAVVLQLACLAVLRGDGYCDTVSLDARRALREVCSGAGMYRAHTEHIIPGTS
jgi:hypothetical protein